MCFSVAPNVTVRQCPTVVNEGNDATLYCDATGNPVPSITWIRLSTGEVTIVSNNNSLVFAAINRNESGLYQCITNNSIGNDLKNCTLDVLCKLNNYVREVGWCREMSAQLLKSNLTRHLKSEGVNYNLKKSRRNNISPKCFMITQELKKP